MKFLAISLNKIALTFLVLALVATAAHGQATTGSILGRVTDSSGSVVAAAEIQIKNENTGLTRSAQSDEDGNYIVSQLPPGTYSATISKTGFKQATQSGIILQIDQKLRWDVSLTVGEITDQVTVTAAVPLLQTQSVETGFVMDSRAITELPLQGRNFTDLTLLTAGVTRGSGGNTLNLSVNGQREFGNSVLVDGIETTGNRNNDTGIKPSVDAVEEFKVSTSAYSAEFGRAAGGVISIETKAGTNEIHGGLFEFYRPSGTAATNYGSTEPSKLRFHNFGANIGAPIKKNKLFVFTSYEGTRLSDVFTFRTGVPPTDQINFLPNGDVDFSGLKDPNTGQTVPIYDPVAFNENYYPIQFPDNIIPADRVSPAGKAILQNFFPAPDRSLPETPNSLNGWYDNFIYRQTYKQDEDHGDLRVDWNISDNDRISGKYHIGRLDTLQGDPYAGHIPVDGGGDGDRGDKIDSRDQSMSISEYHTFNPQWTNEVRFGYSRFRLNQLSLLNGTDYSTQFGVNNIAVEGFPSTIAFPEIYLGSGYVTGGSTFKPLFFKDKNYQLINTVSGRIGKHDLKFGADWRYVTANPQFSLFPTGYMYFSGAFASYTSDPSYTYYDPSAFFGNGGSDLADLLLGLPMYTDIGLQLADPVTASWEMSFFAQDTWQVTPKLVLTYGLRYEYKTPFTEIDNEASNYDPTTNSILIAGRGGNLNSLIRTDQNNFGPRVGFAYRLTPKTVVRSGYGIYYSPENDARSDVLTKNYPFNNQQAYNGGFDFGLYNWVFPYNLDAGVPRDTTIHLPTGSGSIPAEDIPNGPVQSFFYVSPNFPTGYSQLYNFTIQRELPSQLSLEVAYVGSTSRKLPYTVGDINRADGITGEHRITNLLGQISSQFPEGSGGYNSLQVNVTRSRTHGVNFGGSYTYGKSMDNGPAPFNLGRNNAHNQPQDPYNLALERAVSDNDITHNFVFWYVFELPFGRGHKYFNDWSNVAQAVFGGWQVNGIFNARTGTPVNVVRNVAKSGYEGLRPDLVADPVLDRSQRTLDHYFNTDAFSTDDLTGPDQFNLGTAGRNLIRGPGFINLDFSLSKSFQFSERWALQVRAEAFNVTNTPHFANPNSLYGETSFGRITGTIGNPRIMQFAVKLKF